MSHRTLVFCGEERTSRLLTQVLRDLDFTVELQSEPFAAVKLLTEQHFDAVVVDCDNEQNASLLFKSARNSGVNHSSLSVAVVEGQAGIAKAFRIGANLVLTKPIHVEQCKNTLRVARGLIRKAAASKAAGTAPLIETRPAPAPTKESTPDLVPAAPVELDIPAPTLSAAAAAPAAAITAPGPSGSAWELEQEPSPAPDPAEAALLESMPDVVPPQTPGVAISKAATWTPVAELSSLAADVTSSGGGATAPGRAPQPDTRGIEAFEPKTAAAATSIKKDAESKPATGIKKTPSQVSTEPVPELPRFATIGAKKKSEDDAFEPAQSRKNFIIAAVLVLALAAVGYLAWTKFGSSIRLPFIEQQAAPATSAAPPSTVASPSSGPEVAAHDGTGASPRTGETVTSSEESPASAESNGASPPASTSQARPAAKEAETAAPPPGEASDPGNPAASSVARDSSLRAVKVSKTVSQGLLVKRIQPTYPAQAKQHGLEGQVELQASINKEGNVSKLTVLAGNTTLAEAAIDAVRQWKYKPYLLNGRPTDIETQITVNFKLP